VNTDHEVNIFIFLLKKNQTVRSTFYQLNIYDQLTSVKQMNAKKQQLSNYTRAIVLYFYNL